MDCQNSWNEHGGSGLDPSWTSLTIDKLPCETIRTPVIVCQLPSRACSDSLTNKSAATREDLHAIPLAAVIGSS